MVPRRRRLRRIRHLRPVVAAQVRRHRAGGLVHPRPAQVAVHPVRLLRAALPRARNWPGRRTPRTRPTSTSSTSPTASGTRPTTPTTSPGGPAVCRCGSRWRSTGSTPTGRRSRPRRAGPGDRRADQGDPAPGADPGTGPRRRAVPADRLGAGGLRRLGAGAARARRSPSSRRASGRARRSAGSRSCTRTPRWNWCGRSSTGPPERPERRAGGRRRRAGSGQRMSVPATA